MLSKPEHQKLLYSKKSYLINIYTEKFEILVRTQYALHSLRNPPLVWIAQWFSLRVNINYIGNPFRKVNQIVMVFVFLFLFLFGLNVRSLELGNLRQKSSKERNGYNNIYLVCYRLSMFFLQYIVNMSFYINVITIVVNYYLSTDILFFPHINHYLNLNILLGIWKI